MALKRPAANLAPTKGASESDKFSAVKKAGDSRLNTADFYAFLQCQLKMEAEHLMDYKVELTDEAAKRIWPTYSKMAKRNQGANEKWVPYHTILGIHELFVVENIHHAKDAFWSPERRFLALMIFRVTCKGNLFKEVQMPFLKKAGFWKDPASHFKDGSQMEKDLLSFRKKGNALQTSCFLMIPERLIVDDDLNLVRNILRRTQKILELAHTLWPIVDSNKKKSPDELYNEISGLVSQVPGFGDTWVKMLMVCIDLGYPKLKLLQDRCEVGVGAVDSLEQILIGEGLLEPRPAKQQMGPRREPTHETIVVPSLLQGIFAVKRQNKQLLQVTIGMAGDSYDKAAFVAEQLAQLSNKGKDVDELKAKKTELLENTSLSFPAAGWDKKAEEARAKKAGAIQSGEVVQRGAQKAWLIKASEGLSKLQALINNAQSPSSDHFWSLLAKIEVHARKHFKHLDLVVKQMNTPRRTMGASTVQVQLCEFRQFQNYLKKDSDHTDEAQHNGEAIVKPAKRART